MAPHGVGSVSGIGVGVGIGGGVGVEIGGGVGVEIGGGVGVEVWIGGGVVDSQDQSIVAILLRIDPITSFRAYYSAKDGGLNIYIGGSSQCLIRAFIIKVNFGIHGIESLVQLILILNHNTCQQHLPAATISALVVDSGHNCLFLHCMQDKSWSKEIDNHMLWISSSRLEAVKFRSGTYMGSVKVFIYINASSSFAEASLPKESAIKDLFGGEICIVMSPGGSIMASFENVESFFAVHTLSDHLIRTDFEQKGVIPKVVFDIFEKLVFCWDDIPLTMKFPAWVLKSGKMIGGHILCSFFVSDDNIEFLEQKDPPHQS
ncbi:hypothetical protein Tco_0964092 [Tanacetum coccineum]